MYVQNTKFNNENEKKKMYIIHIPLLPAHIVDSNGLFTLSGHNQSWSNYEINNYVF